MITHPTLIFFFFIKYTATTAIYTLSLHDALPIFDLVRLQHLDAGRRQEPDDARDHEGGERGKGGEMAPADPRSEEHTSELQSQSNLVCRLLLEKKKICSGQANYTFCKAKQQPHQH